LKEVGNEFGLYQGAHPADRERGAGQAEASQPQSPFNRILSLNLDC